VDSGVLMPADRSKSKEGEKLSVRIPSDLMARLVDIGERMAAAGWEDPNRSPRGQASSVKARALRGALPLGLDAIEAQLAAAAPDSDTPPEAAAAPPPAGDTPLTRFRERLSEGNVVPRGPDRRAEDGEPPAGKERRSKRRRRTDK